MNAFRIFYISMKIVGRHLSINSFAYIPLNKTHELRFRTRYKEFAKFKNIEEKE